MTKTDLSPTENSMMVRFSPLFGWALALFLFGFHVFAFDVDFGIGIGLFNLTLVSSLLLILPKEKRTALAWTVAGVSAFAGLFFGLRANGFVQSVNTGVMIVSLLLLLAINALEWVEWRGIWLAKYFTLLIPRAAEQIGYLLQTSRQKEFQNKFTVLGVLKTVTLTSVIVIFFAAILSQADPVFAQLIKEVREQAIERVSISLFLAFVASVLVSMRLLPKKDERFEVKWLGYYDLAIPLVAVVALFGVFLVVQFRYLFGEHADLSSFGLTYAEYVRKGFIELMAAAFFGSLFAYAVILKQRSIAAGARALQLQVTVSLLLTELLCVLGSAVKRDLLYVDAYGLSRVRIIGGWFLFWIAGAIALLLALNWWRRSKEQKLWQGLLALSILVVAALNITNIDHIIAQTKRPTNSEGKEIVKDYYYLNNLSEDGRDVWAESIDAAEQNLAFFRTQPTLSDESENQLVTLKLALISLQEKRDRLVEAYDPAKYKWQTYNYSEKKAYGLLQSDRERYFTQLNRLVEDIERLQLEKELDLFDKERRLLNEYDQPFMTIYTKYRPRRLHELKTKYEVPSEVEINEIDDDTPPEILFPRPQN
jgi:hypothetical protein